MQRLMALAQDLEAGENVEIRYLRDGSPRTVSFQTADVDAPSIAIFRSGEGDEPTLRIMRSPGGESVYRVRPGRGGGWSFEGPDKELQELHISRIKGLQELGELKELAELEDLQVHLKDLQLDLQDMDEMERNIIIRGGPGSEAGRWTVRAGEGPAGLFAFRGNSAGFGLKLTEMNPGLSEYFTSDAGLLVLEIDEDSSLGLLPGDVILAIDGRTVSTQRDVDRILGSYEEDEAVSFTVVRKGREIRVEGKAG